MRSGSRSVTTSAGLTFSISVAGTAGLTKLLVDAGAEVHGIDGAAALLAHARRLVPAAEFDQYDLVVDTLPTDPLHLSVRCAAPQVNARALCSTNL